MNDLDHTSFNEKFVLVSHQLHELNKDLTRTEMAILDLREQDLVNLRMMSWVTLTVLILAVTVGLLAWRLYSCASLQGGNL